MAGLTLKIDHRNSVKIGPFELRITPVQANTSRINIIAPPEMLIELFQSKDVIENLESVTDDTIEALEDGKT